MRTPRFAPALLAALLLAGCTAAPAASGDAAASAEAAPSPAAESTDTAEAPAATASTEPLRKMQNGDEAQYYTQQSTPSGLLVYHVVDLTTGEDAIPCDAEGCTHDSETCPAVSTVVPAYQPLVLDDSTLVVISTTTDFSQVGVSSPNPDGSVPLSYHSKILLMDRDCQNRRVLTELDGVDLFWDPSQIYTDGDFLYCYGFENNVHNIYRINLSDGTTANLTENFQDFLFMMGAMGRNFVLQTSDLIYPEPTGDLGADATALPTGTVTHSLLNVDTGEVRELYTYSSDAWNLDNLDVYVVDGQYYQIDRAAGTLSTVDPDTGEVRQISDGLPTADRNTYTSDYQPEAVLDGWMVFYRLPVIVNVETGEVRQRIDLPENYWNGYGHQPSIYLQLQDRLLVDCRYEPYTRTGIGTDGTPYTINTERTYLGLISIDDFLNGVPNYTEVCQRPD